MVLDAPTSLTLRRRAGGQIGVGRLPKVSLSKPEIPWAGMSRSKLGSRTVAEWRRLPEPSRRTAHPVSEQVDTFYTVPHGRLKLRTFADESGELIHYERPDRLGPEESHYVRVPISDPVAFHGLLSDALGVRGIVRKRRTIYLVGQTRVHLDEVEGLGTFLELEVVLAENQGTHDGHVIASELMDTLGMPERTLVSEAYIDLIAGT